MYYVCIENNLVTSIMPYEPAVPSTVNVVEITKIQYDQIMTQTHRFDVASNTVVAVDPAEIAQREQYKLNGLDREFLNSTDWKILRHLRQKALNVTTTMSEVEFLELEQQRQAAAARIV